MMTFNLLPWRKYQYRLQRSQLMRHVVYSVGCALVLQAVWHSALIMQLAKQTEILTTLQVQAEQLDDTLAIHSHSNAIKFKLDAHDRLKLYGLLREMNSIHHFDLCLTTIDYKRNILTVIGNAYSYFDLRQFLNAYREHKYNKQLKISSLKTNKQQQINFKLINIIE